LPGETSAALSAVAPELEPMLSGTTPIAGLPEVPAIRRETLWVETLDGLRLATDLYLPPALPAPVVTIRTPYGRGQLAETFLALARRGYAVVAQDCRGTGDSEPDHWDFLVHEQQDGLDLIEWITRQEWFDGFIASCGGSYVGWTQWCMAMHPAMSAIAPEVAEFGVSHPERTPGLYMFVNAYARSVGHGADDLAIGYEETERQMTRETNAGGYFNERLHDPLPDALIERYPDLGSLPPAAARRRLWERYRALPVADRVEMVKLALGEDRLSIADLGRWSALFPRAIGNAYLMPHTDAAELFGALQAPALVITGWYDWGLGPTLATWQQLTRHAPEPVRSRSRLLITPGAHNMPGYHEAAQDHPELQRVYRTAHLVDLLHHWYTRNREDVLEPWPTVIYYLMGANQWRATPAWPPPEARTRTLYLGGGGTLTDEAPPAGEEPDRYLYDPHDPTPTVGGSIVSNVYTPGSVDVGEVQRRPDVLTYTTPPLEHDLDVVGPLHLVLYAASSAVDTDFVARLTDVFPDGRAIQVQSGALRARYRTPSGEPELLQAGEVYRLDIDMWATANRFAAGHRLRLDISSADFPRYDRNTGRGGEPGPPIPGRQTIYHDQQHRSRLQLFVVDLSGKREQSMR
jgi:uncharacterized protein